MLREVKDHRNVIFYLAADTSIYEVLKPLLQILGSKRAIVYDKLRKQYPVVTGHGVSSASPVIKLWSAG